MRQDPRQFEHVSMPLTFVVQSRQRNALHFSHCITADMGGWLAQRGALMMFVAIVGKIIR